MSAGADPTIATTARRMGGLVITLSHGSRPCSRAFLADAAIGAAGASRPNPRVTRSQIGIHSVPTSAVPANAPRKPYAASRRIASFAATNRAERAAREEKSEREGTPCPRKRATDRLRSRRERRRLRAPEEDTKEKERSERDRERVCTGNDRPDEHRGGETTSRAETIDDDTGERSADEVRHREGADQPAVVRVVDRERLRDRRSDRRERLAIDVADAHSERRCDRDRPRRRRPPGSATGFFSHGGHREAAYRTPCAEPEAVRQLLCQCAEMQCFHGNRDGAWAMYGERLHSVTARG